mmetsp:Transcript_10209/g.29969  ORF Transcript_10209/g.29969 Transcript_10209/m.29969 type:complete len:369 (+) Transcript_10209:167-1273(+)|eukprot:CAMPEP_0172373018 /NCGR_PEP_ID=MMETSP1060-20121228/50116_1 /TAXON_ID=37318 /ORGANISM="Pseudo-nitzschia pungens, Strain cf. cingulata" /LENGTH=368 /DNA_ID=CAMNT_0013099213 /DNA_START=161 /DNA_END=1267 /DNA_ORIENTATION=+
MPFHFSALRAVQICSTAYLCHFADAFTFGVINPSFSNVNHEFGVYVRVRNPPIRASGKFLSAAPRYGPPISSDGEDENDLLPSPAGQFSPTRTNKEEFRALVEQVMKTTKSELVPRLLVNNIELILGLQGKDGTEIISSILEDAKSEDTNEQDDGDSAYTQTLQTVEIILSFAEDFVQQAQEMDSNNKKLLGKIIKAMVKTDNDTSISGGEGRNLGEEDMASKREEALDSVMKEEKKNFSTGFLRHIEGECDRIANQPKMTQESARLLDILRMVQTRVLEELGQDLGEAALVLGQLMGYEKEEELLGVLEAGLTVRGNDFALEMASLTEEALDGFSRVPGGADPDLVEKVKFIDGRLQEFLNETNEFQ